MTNIHVPGFNFLEFFVNALSTKSHHETASKKQYWASNKFTLFAVELKHVNLKMNSTEVVEGIGKVTFLLSSAACMLCSV